MLDDSLKFYIEGLWYKSYAASPVLGLAGWLFGTGYLFMYYCCAVSIIVI